MKYLLKGGKVIDPANQIQEVRDVLVEDGRIVAVEKDIKAAGAEVIDLQGMIVAPGFIDMHVHLREPGFEYKEDIASGTRAAAVGGFTTLCCMPNTNPVIDSLTTASFVRERAKKSGVVNVFPIGALTKKQEGQELSAIADLVAAGCVALSDDGKPVMKSNVMRNGLEYAKMFDLPVLSHCEDLNLSQDGQMHEGYYSTIYGLRGIPAEAEDIIVGRDILLTRLTDSRLHICHISTEGALELVRQAKREGLSVTCEVTPHHLALSDELVGSYDADTKVNPPLRSSEHIAALIEAVNDGTIDCIATDHAPHQMESKDCEYALASSGISGLETAVAVCMDMINQGVLDLNRVISMFTLGPARILGLQKGSLSPKTVADITVIDPRAVKIVDPDHFYSKSKNNPFKGRELTGWPFLTMVGGRIIAREGQLVE
ncbi:MAG TPA: dihydroorotase [Syntrophomonadaceae bacterium]|nr:dihydroorotase [Syntrophomonadaceae bacterium]